MADDNYSSGVKPAKPAKEKSARKVNRKRIGVTRVNRKTGKRENFLDIYVDWPVRKEGDFEFGSGNDLTPYASVSKYVRTNDVAWRFELSNAYVYLEALLSGSHGRGQFTGLYEDPYDVTWKVEQKYYKGA